jgi:hypothetical protein
MRRLCSTYPLPGLNTIEVPPAVLLFTAPLVTGKTIGLAVAVGVAVAIADEVAVAVVVTVEPGLGVADAVELAEAVLVAVWVAVEVAEAVLVEVAVAVGAVDAVGVAVAVAINVIVAVGVGRPVTMTVGVASIVEGRGADPRGCYSWSCDRGGSQRRRGSAHHAPPLKAIVTLVASRARQCGPAEQSRQLAADGAPSSRIQIADPPSAVVMIVSVATLTESIDQRQMLSPIRRARIDEIDHHRAQQMHVTSRPLRLIGAASSSVKPARSPPLRTAVVCSDATRYAIRPP